MILKHPSPIDTKSRDRYHDRVRSQPSQPETLIRNSQVKYQSEAPTRYSQVNQSHPGSITTRTGDQSIKHNQNQQARTQPVCGARSSFKQAQWV